MLRIQSPRSSRTYGITSETFLVLDFKKYLSLLQAAPRNGDRIWFRNVSVIQPPLLAVYNEQERIFSLVFNKLFSFLRRFTVLSNSATNHFIAFIATTLSRSLRKLLLVKMVNIQFSQQAIRFLLCALKVLATRALNHQHITQHFEHLSQRMVNHS